MSSTPGLPAPAASSIGLIPRDSDVVDPTSLCKDCGAPIDLGGDSSIGRCGSCADAHWCAACEDDRDECGHPPMYDTPNWRLLGEDDDELINPPRFVQPRDLTPGQQVDLWADRGGGYSGLTVVEVGVDELLATGGTNPEVRAFPWSDYVAVSTHNDGKLVADACLEHGSGDCHGDVEYRTYARGSGRPFPRCVRHDEKRRQMEENDPYPDSPIAPSWFREDDIGERWDDDY
ncbi:MAG TPA: hypothetical protein VHD87_15275 [Acidimicrobiales bacterium]|nr:hypothetical protein [Acidimicrobiales bacterium]